MFGLVPAWIGAKPTATRAMLIYINAAFAENSTLPLIGDSLPGI